MQDQNQAGPDALSAYFSQIADAAQTQALGTFNALFPLIRQVLAVAVQGLKNRIRINLAYTRCRAGKKDGESC